jgi:hypothetical protein
LVVAMVETLAVKMVSVSADLWASTLVALKAVM